MSTKKHGNDNAWVEETIENICCYLSYYMAISPPRIPVKMTKKFRTTVNEEEERF
jgi:hypothetical protein